MVSMELTGAATTPFSLRSRVYAFYKVYGALEAADETPMIKSFVNSDVDTHDSVACDLQPGERFNHMVLWKLDTGIEFAIPKGRPLSAARSGEQIHIEELELTAVCSAPEIHYDSDTVKWWRFYAPWLQEAIDRGIALAEQHSVIIERVHVSRFVSVEDEKYEECVISFYSRSNRSNLIKFSPILAENLGDWIVGQAELVPAEIGEFLSFGVLPMEFWQNVRS